jgi:hypothetical protein
MLRPPESVENKNDHDLPFNIAGLMQSLAERGAKRLRPTHRCGSQSQGKNWRNEIAALRDLDPAYETGTRLRGS